MNFRRAPQTPISCDGNRSDQSTYRCAMKVKFEGNCSPNLSCINGFCILFLRLFITYFNWDNPFYEFFLQRKRKSRRSLYYILRSRNTIVVKFAYKIVIVFLWTIENGTIQLIIKFFDNSLLLIMQVKNETYSLRSNYFCYL